MTVSVHESFEHYLTCGIRLTTAKMVFASTTQLLQQVETICAYLMVTYTRTLTRAKMQNAAATASRYNC